MRIHEAVEIAGPGGKIQWGGYIFEVPKDNSPLKQIGGGGHNGCLCPSKQMLVTDGWEVIAEERIEVGDDVKRTDVHGGHCKTGKVAGINSDEDAVIIYEGNTFGCASLDHLKLIRKGSKKHVFEGVQWKDIPCPQDAFGATSACVPHSKTPAQGLVDLCDNGKTYRMTLEEIG